MKKRIRWKKRTFVLTQDFSGVPENLRLIRIVAKNGVWLVGKIKQRDSVFVEIAARTKPFKREYAIMRGSDLDEFLPNFSIASLIPFSLLLQAKGFFRSVLQLHGTEAMLDILFYPDTNKWDLRPLHQQVTRWTVTHEEQEERPEGSLSVGILHSHGWMQAWHSETDDKAELAVDGIYITMGSVHTPLMDISVSVVVHGKRFILPDPSWAIDLEDGQYPFPQEWLDYVQKTGLLEPELEDEMEMQIYES